MTDEELATRVTELELAVLSMARQEFVGDLPGHPFHGNQWKTGNDIVDQRVSDLKVSPGARDTAVLIKQGASEKDLLDHVENARMNASFARTQADEGDHPDGKQAGVRASRDAAKYHADAKSVVEHWQHS